MGQNQGVEWGVLENGSQSPTGVLSLGGGRRCGGREAKAETSHSVLRCSCLWGGVH